MNYGGGKETKEKRGDLQRNPSRTLGLQETPLH